MHKSNITTIFIYSLTSPASCWNMDLKESSMSSSVISAYKKPYLLNSMNWHSKALAIFFFVRRFMW